MKSLLLLLFFSWKPDAPVCSCAGAPPFLEVAPYSNLIVVGTVKRYATFNKIYQEATPMSMEVDVLSVWKGREQRKTITVWGDPGNLCRPYLSVFTPGQSYVFNLEAAYAGSGNEGEQDSDYAISICGEHSLRFNKQTGTASGRISEAGKVESIDTATLRTRIFNQQ